MQGKHAVIPSTVLVLGQGMGWQKNSNVCLWYSQNEVCFETTIHVAAINSREVLLVACGCRVSMVGSTSI